MVILTAEQKESCKAERSVMGDVSANDSAVLRAVARKIPYETRIKILDILIFLLGILVLFLCGYGIWANVSLVIVCFGLRVLVMRF